jgi:hypothetical protein
VISGCDLVDGTPVVDIKPYLPYADCIRSASHGIAQLAPELLPVAIDPAAEAACSEFQRESKIDLAELLRQVLAQDPKPAYHVFHASRVYSMRLFDRRISWGYSQQSDKEWRIHVTSVVPEPVDGDQHGI